MSERKFESLSPELQESLLPTSIDDLLVSVKYYVDEDYAHISIKSQEVCEDCEHKPCLDFCPAHVFSVDQQGTITVSFQACVECGSCRVGCPYENVEWTLPRGGYGVAYKFG